MLQYLGGRVGWNSFAAAIFVFAALSAKAELTTFTFAGKVSSISDPGGVLGNQVSIGDGMGASFLTSDPFSFTTIVDNQYFYIANFSTNSGSTVSAGNINWSNNSWTANAFDSHQAAVDDNFNFTSDYLADPSYLILWEVNLDRDANGFPSDSFKADPLSILNPNTLHEFSITLKYLTKVYDDNGGWHAGIDLVGAEVDGTLTSYQVPTPVPEPATYGFIGAASLCVAAVISRRRNRTKQFD